MPVLSKALREAKAEDLIARFSGSWGYAQPSSGQGN